MWDWADAEGVSDGLYRTAGADPDEPPGPRTLARMLGLRVARAPRRGLWGMAELVRAGDAWIVFLAPHLGAADEGFAIAHELAEWWLIRCGQRGSWVEDLADASAAAIVAPRPAYRRAVEAFGDDFAALADAFVTTQSLVALRWGEVKDVPLALVTPDVVRVRGPAWEWPAVETIRRWARATPEDVERRDLSDARGRVVLRAA